MNDDLRRLLEEAGQREVPPVADSFADTLEARLRAVASGLPAAGAEQVMSGAAAPGPGAPEPRRRRSSPRWLLAGLGAVLVVAVLAVLVGQPRQVPQSTFVPVAALAGPVNVEVVLPDGVILEDPDGLVLPPGSVIRVGEGGSARIGDAILVPGDVATVGEERVLVEHAAPQAVVIAPTPARTPHPTATGGRTPAPSGTPATGTPSPASPATPGPTPAASPSPSPSPLERTPVPTRLPTARPEPGTTPAATVTPSPSPPILRPRLRARLITGPRIAVTWTETWRAKSYVLIASLSRSGPASDPVYPGSRVLGEFTAPPERPLRYRVPAGVVEVKLQVLALRGNGAILRRSRIVTIVVPQPSASPSSDLTGGPTLDPSPGATPDPGPSTGP